MLDSWEFGDPFGREITDHGQVEVRTKRAKQLETDFSSTWRTLGPVSIQLGAWLAPKVLRTSSTGSILIEEAVWPAARITVEHKVGWDTGLEERFHFSLDAMIPWFCTVCVFSQENKGGKRNSSGSHVGRQKFLSWPSHQWPLSKTFIFLTFAYSSANHFLSFHSFLAYHPTSLFMLWAFILVIPSTW